MKIVVLDDYCLSQNGMDWHDLYQFGEVFFYGSSNAGNVLKRIADAVVVFTNKTKLPRELLMQCSSLKFIGVLATGYDVVDINAARELGIIVSNVPAYGTASVAQYTMALVLELCHQVGAHNTDVHSGGWLARKQWCYYLNPLLELDGKNMGLIGFGRIGQAFANISQSFGMNVLAYDEYPNLNMQSPSLRYVTLDELYEHSDVISLHCPLSENTAGIINAQCIEKMKPGVLIVNTSRGGLVVESDLAAALNSGRVGGAAVDVLSTEPPMPGNPLLGAKNCIITPHIAWATHEARQRIVKAAIGNLRAFMDGRAINVVNMIKQ